MSVGISILQEKEKLYNVCKRLNQKGVHLIAAFDNYGSVSYPAQFDCVVGVCESEKCRKNDEFIFAEGLKSINVLANGNMQRCLWKNPLYQMCSGNSFACAHVTGIVANNFLNIEKKFSNNILSFLKENCTEILYLKEENYSIHLPRDYDNMRAIIFPFNKENHSLIRYSNLLSFKIVNVYESKYSGKVGAYTNDLLKLNIGQNYLIKNIENIDFDDFDLLILGHTKELERLTNLPDYGKKLVKKSLDLGKMVYSYDEYDEYEGYANYFNPNVKWNENYRRPLGKLYRSSTPIVGIFGTTSKQGKFSLQLILREKFLKDGYKLGQISSEPSGFLFNMDYCIPFGYGVMSPIIREKMVQYINILLHKLDEKDIVLVGCQSSTLPYDNGNISDFTFSQIEFLLSTTPDCVVLCVNPFDLVEDIERTIKFIESVSKSEVIALVIFPMKLRDSMAGIYSERVQISEEEKEYYIKQYSSRFHKPTFILGEKMNDLYNIVLDFFV